MYDAHCYLQSTRTIAHFSELVNMNDHKIDHSGERLKEERFRIDMQQIDFAEACGVSRGALLKWEKGEAAPNAMALAVMDTLGIDVLYVVTGRRSTDSETRLVPAEQALLAAWRNSSIKGRALLSAAVDVLRPE